MQTDANLVDCEKCCKMKISLFISEKSLTIFGWNFEVWAVQKYAHLSISSRASVCTLLLRPFVQTFIFQFLSMSLLLNLLFEQIAIPTSIYLQKSASIQPRTSPSKFGGKIQFNIHSPPRSCPRRASNLQSWCRMARCQARSSRCSCLRSGVAGDGGLGSWWGPPSLSWEDSGRGLRALWRVHRQRTASADR